MERVITQVIAIMSRVAVDWDVPRLAPRPFESLERLLRRGGQFGQAVRRCPPQDLDVHPVVGMPQSVAHAADVGPGLARHEFVGLVAEPDRGFAYALDAAFDSVPRPIVAGEGLLSSPER